VLGREGFTIEEAVMVDMFPQTHHLEAVVLLVKQA